MKNIDVKCPSCSPNQETSHAILKNTKNIHVKCEECGYVHELKTEKEIPLRIIISKSDKSFHKQIFLSGKLSIGDELLVDDEDETILVEVSSIEIGDKRKNSARVEEITTIWARAINEVILKISLNLRETTKPIELKVSGDKEYVVGDKINISGYEYEIKQIKKRKGGFVRKKGESVKAKDIKRIFAGSNIKLLKKISKKREGSLIKKQTSGWSIASSNI